MGHRLSKIYTRTGDDGTTGLGDGSRVAKDDARVEAYGTVDELNSVVGLVLAAPDLPEAVRTCLTSVQHDLFDLGGELCIPGHRMLSGEHVASLERTLDDFNEALPPLKEFILPSGGPATAACHLARAVCRRAERRLWTLIRREAAAASNSAPTSNSALTSKSAAGSGAAGAPRPVEAHAAPVNPEAAKYLNRLSDLLFVIARVLVRHERGTEVLWRHDRGRTRREPA
jgi:cob(I)alamin adenosyltransferase